MEQTEIERLTKIAYRAESIFDHAYKYLKSFWNRDMSCFHTNEQAKVDRYASMTNTSFALFAILESKGLIHNFCQNEAPASGDTFFLSIAKTLLKKKWKSENLNINNIYTAPIVLVALYRLKNETVDGREIDKLIKSDYLEKVTKSVKKICTIIETEKAAVYNGYEPSAYLTYWSYLALRYASEDNSIDDKLKLRCAKNIEAVASWGESEVLAQLAYKTACDLASFDATQLAYALMIYVENNRKCGLRANKRTVKAAIDLFLSEQQDDGLWPEGHPIFHYAKRGNVYTFTFEVLAVLLSKPEEIKSLLEPHCIEKLEASLEWVELNEITNEMKGWRSNHLSFGDGAEAWSTAAVLVSMIKIKELVGMYLHNTVCSEYRAVIHESPGKTFLESKDYYDSNLTYVGEKYSLKETIEKHLIKSHLPGSSEHSDRKYSAVFFGPPGTGKTSFAKDIAIGLGWPYIELQTSDFSGEGMDKITGNARKIFRELGLLNNAVVLFDEVEEFVRDRSDKSLPPHSRMITTTMLSLIQELYKKKKVIFVVATNYLMTFDDAIKRAGGRFDMLLLIGPPSLEEKARMFCHEAKEKWALNEADETALSVKISKFIKDNEDPVEYYNFHEWKTFVNIALQKSAEYSGLNDVILENVLRQTKQKIILANCDDNITYKDYKDSKNQVRI